MPVRFLSESHLLASATWSLLLWEQGYADGLRRGRAITWGLAGLSGALLAVLIATRGTW